VQAAIVLGDNLDILVQPPAVRVLVLEARVREAHVSVVIRQVMLACPPFDLLGLAVRTAVAVASATIALVEEPLVVPLHLVIEDDAPDAPAAVADLLLSALVGAVDLDVVGELTRLPEAGVERLAGLVRPLVTWDRAIGFEQIPAPVGEDDGTAVGVERRPPNQPFVFEVADALLGRASVVAERGQVVLRDHAKGADRRQHGGLGAVDVVDPVAAPDWFPFGATWKVEVTREDITGMTVPTAGRIGSATATEVAASITGVVARVVAIEHSTSR
jgi:hypothetical protein